MSQDERDDLMGQLKDDIDAAVCDMLDAVARFERAAGGHPDLTCRLSTAAFACHGLGVTTGHLADLGIFLAVKEANCKGPPECGAPDLPRYDLKRAFGARDPDDPSAE